jgi:hypothetical protein
MADKQTAPIDPWTAPRSAFADVTLDQLSDYAAMIREDSAAGGNIYSEIRRREMIAQIQLLDATREAARATVDAAAQSRRNATWMMWSVFVAAASALVAAISVTIPFIRMQS